MKKLLIGILALIVIAIVVFVVQQKPAENYVVKIGNIPTIASRLPLEIAKQKGFFADEGVAVQSTEMQSSNLIADALVRNDIDITSGISVLPFLNAQIVDGGKMQIFSAMDLTTDEPFDSIIVKTGSSIKDLKDLEGKKIGVFLGTTATNMLKLLFKTHSIDSSKMQFVQLAPADQLAALTAGSIDALFSYEPTTAIALDEGKMRRIYGSVFAEQVTHSPLGTGLLSSAFVAAHPREAQKVTDALNRAYDYILTNPKESREIMATSYKFSPRIADAVFLPHYNHGEKINKDIVDTLVNLFVSVGEIKSKPDLTNVYYKD